MVIRRNRDSTRSRLLAAARALFSEQGYEATSVRQIAAAAGVDAALIFRYFGSKDGIFVAATAAEDPARLAELPAREAADVLLEMVAGREDASAIAALLRSSSGGEGQRRLQAAVCGPYLSSLEAEVQGEDPRLQAELVAAWVIGVAVMRGMLPSTTVARAPFGKIRARSRIVVDALLSGAQR